jgi:hypothetical protein
LYHSLDLSGVWGCRDGVGSSLLPVGVTGHGKGFGGRRGGFSTDCWRILAALR